jgi:YidC/Oxa1 family membrane protein insertase
MGLAIIMLTLLIKLVTIPLSKKQIKAQKDQHKMKEFQAKIKEIQKKYKDDRETQSRKLAALYKEYNINPLGSCLPLLIQLPIFIALFRILRDGINPESLDLLYSFVKNPGELNTIAFGFLDLSKSSPVLAVIAGIAQFFQTKMLTPKKKKEEAKDKKEETGTFSEALSMSTGQMTYFMPALMVFFYWQFPAGLPLYSTTQALFSIGQQYFMLNKKKKKHSSSKKKKGKKGRNKKKINRY